MIVQTCYGPVEGVPCDGYTVYRGIRYAKAPVGELRFRPPCKPEPFESVFHADHFGPMCPQDRHDTDSFYDKEFYGAKDFQPGVSEDCLHLNIWTPPFCEGVKYPVAVWIHGGAFFNGYNSEVEFDGAEFARRGVILVTINYRVGLWGFLCHPWLAQEDPDGRCGNYGLLDQIFALQYVRENIGAFGGDPDRVTIFGQSAGAFSVQALMVSPLTKGLFRQAVLHSGGIDEGFARESTVQAAMKKGEEFMRRFGISSLEQLRKTPWQLLQTAANDCFHHRSGMRLYSPVADGFVLPETEEGILDSEKAHSIPCILGATANDIPRGGDPDGLMKTCVGFAERTGRIGSAPNYLYSFRRHLPGDGAGAFHSADLWYLFGTLERSWRPFEERDRELSRRICDCWCSFFRTGDPGWKPYTAEERFIEVFE